MINKDSLENYVAVRQKNIDRSINALERQKSAIKKQFEHYNVLMGYEFFSRYKEDNGLKYFNRRFPNFSYKKYPYENNIYGVAEVRGAIEMHRGEGDFRYVFNAMCKNEKDIVNDSVFAILRKTWNEVNDSVLPFKSYLAETSLAQSLELRQFVEYSMISIYNRKMKGPVYEAILQGKHPVINHVPLLIKEAEASKKKDPFYLASKM
jgi:hypothetical protein